MDKRRLGKLLSAVDELITAQENLEGLASDFLEMEDEVIELKWLTRSIKYRIDEIVKNELVKDDE